MNITQPQITEWKVTINGETYGERLNGTIDLVGLIQRIADVLENA